MSQATEALVNAGHIPPIPAIVPPPELANDPNEPKYCICNQVSYGDMIGCDNEDVRRFVEPSFPTFVPCYRGTRSSLISFCVFYSSQCKIEWFHYPCVGIIAPAPDEWQCPDCTEQARKKRKRQG